MRRIVSTEPVQTEVLQVRLLDEQKRTIIKAAKRKGLTLSEFTRQALTAAAASQAA